MYQKIMFLFVLSLFLLSAGRQVHSQTDVLWSKYFYEANGVKFSADGNVVLVAQKDKIFLLDTYSGEPTMYEKIPYNMGLRKINRIEISNDGRFILGSSGSNTKLWYFESGELYKYIKDRDGTSSVALLPDSRHMVTADQTDNKNNVFIWDIEDSVKIKSGDLQGRALDIAVSGDGRYISFRQILGSSECVSLWSVDEFQQIERLGCIGDYKNINDMAFSPDGRYLAATYSNGYIKIWDTDTFGIIVDMLHTNQSDKNLWTGRIRFSNNSQFLISGGGYFDNTTTKVWKFPEMELMNIYEDPYGATSVLDFTPDERIMVVGTIKGKIYVVNFNFETSVISKVKKDTITYPNPVKDILILPISHPITSDLSLKLFNSSGEFIKLFSIEDFNIDSTTIKLNISYLIPSAYFINITSNGFSMTYSFIKI
jgi:WD40 repeat protein